MTTMERKKSHLRLLLIAAAVLGSLSATLGGALTMMALQHPPVRAGAA